VWGGKGPRQLATELGSIPRSIASVEVYEALDKATIDARAETTPMVKTYKHYEICKYIADIGVGTTGSPVYAMSINMKKWKSLPKDIQADILAVTADWWKNFEKRVSETQINDRTFLQKEGMEFVDFNAADKAKVMQLPVFQDFRNKYSKRIKDNALAAKIYDRYRELIINK
jgi:TRAP-type C4-dicarboxylate transport system substrate-binding protein